MAGRQAFIGVLLSCTAPVTIGATALPGQEAADYPPCPLNPPMNR